MIAMPTHNCTMADPRVPNRPNHAPRRWVACLCADWCGTCRDYRPVFDTVAAQHPEVVFLWLDIEDEAALVGDLDIETFPTVLVADGAVLRFAGPSLPQGSHLARLLAALDSGAAVNMSDPSLAALVQALHQRILTSGE